MIKKTKVLNGMIWVFNMKVFSKCCYWEYENYERESCNRGRIKLLTKKKKKRGKDRVFSLIVASPREILEKLQGRKMEKDEKCQFENRKKKVLHAPNSTATENVRIMKEREKSYKKMEKRATNIKKMLKEKKQRGFVEEKIKKGRSLKVKTRIFFSSLCNSFFSFEQTFLLSELLISWKHKWMFDQVLLKHEKLKIDR